AEVRLFQEALKECPLPCRVLVLRDSSEVTAFVHQQPSFATVFPLHLIILDIQLPGMELEELVAALRRLPAWTHPPLICFSVYDAREGQRRTAHGGATAFVPKPMELHAFFASVQQIVRHWGLPQMAQHAESAS